MATKKKTTDETADEFNEVYSFEDKATVTNEILAPTMPVVSPKPAAPRPQVKRISFIQYAALKDIPERRRPGLLAFIKYPQKKRSIEEWDSCFKNY